MEKAKEEAFSLHFDGTHRKLDAKRFELKLVVQWSKGMVSRKLLDEATARLKEAFPVEVFDVQVRKHGAMIHAIVTKPPAPAKAKRRSVP